MQAMFPAFISTNTSGIPLSKANPIGRTFPPLFTINLPGETNNQRLRQYRRHVGFDSGNFILFMCDYSYHNCIPHV